jgi:hypothetical protein
MTAVVSLITVVPSRTGTAEVCAWFYPPFAIWLISLTSNGNLRSPEHFLLCELFSNTGFYRGVPASVCIHLARFGGTRFDL